MILLTTSVLHLFLSRSLPYLFTYEQAVIAVEMTGNLNMLLPCLVVAVIGAGIAKSKGLSVYDQGMVNKGLESFQLLLVEKSGSGAHRFAGSVMDEHVVSVPQKCPVLKLIKLLELTNQTVFPMVSDASDGLKLLGTVGRRDIYHFLLVTFTADGLEDVIRVMLPTDSLDEDYRMSKAKKRAALRKQRAELYGSIMRQADTFLFHDEVANKASQPTSEDNVNRNAVRAEEGSMDINTNVAANIDTAETGHVAGDPKANEDSGMKLLYSTLCLCLQ